LLGCDLLEDFDRSGEVRGVGEDPPPHQQHPTVPRSTLVGRPQQFQGLLVLVLLGQSDGQVGECPRLPTAHVCCTAEDPNRLSCLLQPQQHVAQATEVQLAPRLEPDGPLQSVLRLIEAPQQS